MVEVVRYHCYILVGYFYSSFILYVGLSRPLPVWTCSAKVDARGVCPYRCAEIFSGNSQTIALCDELLYLQPHKNFKMLLVRISAYSIRRLRIGVRHANLLSSKYSDCSQRYSPWWQTKHEFWIILVFIHKSQTKCSMGSFIEYIIRSELMVQ
jgi:hypothetical protein